ncbi:MAG: shikimate dehydrogenase [Lachnospiraceae bacterium]|nr:shikimate dehydrogenase [Lachnospiraceae bacterium]
MKINGKSKICGLIGNPVAHTLSPLIHNAVAEKMGHNLFYAAFHVKDEDGLENAVNGAYALGIAGINVTVPYKTAVIPFLKAVDPKAALTGAVNTLVRCELGFMGHNTDNLGLLRAMESEGIKIKDSNVLLLGAGGAGRCAAFLCAEQEARRVFIINRSKDKAVNLAAEINQLFKKDCFSGIGPEDVGSLPKSDFIAIQSTSLGMCPNENETLIKNRAFFERIKAGIDMIYNPAETLFMKYIKEAGGKAVNGQKMLLYQGILAYELWSNETVPEEIIAAVDDLLTEAVNNLAQ